VTQFEHARARGVVLAVCLGPGGIPKHPVASAFVEASGLAGDGHRFRFHGGPDRAVCLFAIEDYRTLAAEGVPCDAPGSFGENLLTAGLDYADLRPGDRLAVGEDVRLEIHDVREPCGTLKKLDARFPDLMLGRSGYLCRVVHGGVVRPGMDVVLEHASGRPAS
jgi:MOSC domain-containing protein YiiM